MDTAVMMSLFVVEQGRRVHERHVFRSLLHRSGLRGFRAERLTHLVARNQSSTMPQLELVQHAKSSGNGLSSRYFARSCPVKLNS